MAKADRLQRRLTEAEARLERSKATLDEAKETEEREENLNMLYNQVGEQRKVIKNLQSQLSQEEKRQKLRDERGY